MSSTAELSVLERRDRAIDHLDQGHQALRHALEGLESEDAFLGSRWSVRDVLLHLDSENFIDALEKIAAGKQQMLPSFSTQEDHLRKEMSRLEKTHLRLRSLVLGLNENQLTRPITPPNPHNSYPGLTMLELIERVSDHESTHARQIQDTRKYVEAFKSKERALTVMGLGNGEPALLTQAMKDLLNQADYVVAEPAVLDVVRNWVRGVELPLNEYNAEEIIARMGREVRSGIWAVVCSMGEIEDDSSGTLALARQHADAVVIHQAKKT